ncbi:MAG TPA: MFS transporter [Kiritimatiellia bacterium]|nr:MFS transporter [Kiritimatiellia bacterium]HMO98576.1 MFS transporter [Kiritimatiellia bacterium]HMP95445.1 MFS transporter [Kiritimatiellia bacterium]
MSDEHLSDGGASRPEPVFRPDLLARQRVQRTLWMSIVEGGFTQIFLVWTSGSILTGLMLHFGATPRELAAVVSLPFLVQLLNPFSAWLVASLGSRKQFMMVAGSLGRGIWMVPVLLPLIGLPAPLLPRVMLGVVFLSALFQNSLGPAWASLMADVVPEATRGRYFGLRNGLLGVIGTASALGAGYFLDHTPEPAGFQMVLLIAVLCAMVGIRLYGFHYEPRMPKPGLALSAMILEPFRDANFRKFLRFAVYWNASVMLAAPFVIPYFFQHLRMTYTQLALWSAIASVATLFIGAWWGRVADRVGHKQVLKVTTFIAGSAHPACWMLATPGHLTFVWISGIMDALSWGGINAAMFNLSVVTAPRDKRMMYLAVIGAVSGLAGFAAGLCSGFLLDWLLAHERHFGDFHWTGYHSLFAISGMLRMQAWWFLGPIQEVRAVPTRQILRWLWNRTQNLLPWRMT